MSAIIFTIVNHKGGVGKTTTAASLGYALSLKGNKVLLIDLDAQQNLTFIIIHNEEPENSVYDALVRDKGLPIISINENLDIVPASLELARAEIDLANRMARESLLMEKLEPIRGMYDYILIDCPPYLGIVTTNALVASDRILIPLTAEALPLKGLTMLEDVVEEVQRRVNPKLQLGGLLLTRFNNRKLNREVLSHIEAKYGELVFKTRIRENIALAEMPLSGKSIFEYDPKSNGASDYSALAVEFSRRFPTE